MNKEEKKAILKSHLQDYLESRGIDTRKNFNCLDPAHEDSNPSMSYWKEQDICHCFSCNANLDIFDLIGIDYNLSNYKDQFNKACNIYGLDEEYQTNTATKNLQPKTEKYKQASTGKNKTTPNAPELDLRDYFRKVRANIGQTDYLQSRGISEEIIGKYFIGYDPNFKTNTGGKNWKAIIIPTSKSTYIARNINPSNDKEKIRAVGHRTPFNLGILYKADNPIWIVEGEIDALSLLEIGIPAVGLGGVSNTNKLVDSLARKKPTQPLIIAMDNDKVGLEQSNGLKIKLDDLGIANYQMKNAYNKYKDPNEFLTADRDLFITTTKEISEDVKRQEVQKEEIEKEEYISKHSSYSYINDFLELVQRSKNHAYISTGYNGLDNLMDGGFYEGLYILGAGTGIGKTTLALNIIDQIAENQDQDILIFSLEMSRLELIAKSISRLTAQICMEENIYIGNAKTTRGITTGVFYESYTAQEIELIKKATNRYISFSNKIFIDEGVGDIGVEHIRQTVENHVRITGRKPLVLIDYLQILAPYNERSSDKQNTDKAVIELKRLSRDFNIPVLAISSFNRENYKKEVNLAAFKESGAIEYGSDMVLGLQVKDKGKDQAQDEKKESDREMELELKILKNRHGKKYTSQDFTFYTYYNLYKEN